MALDGLLQVASNVQDLFPSPGTVGGAGRIHPSVGIPDPTDGHVMTAAYPGCILMYRSQGSAAIPVDAEPPVTAHPYRHPRARAGRECRGGLPREWQHPKEERPARCAHW